MSLSSFSIGAVASLAALLAAILSQVPFIRVSGVLTVLEPVGNKNCTTVQGAQACDKTVLHAPSGLVYMACSTIEDRHNWAPYSTVATFKKPSRNDFVAFFDPFNGAINRMHTEGFDDSSRGFNLHGLDVVPSRVDPSVLFVYLVNHRPQVSGGTNEELGADSVVEVFKTTVGSQALVHVKTFRDPRIIVTPHDVSGSADGDSFFFTNDFGDRLSMAKRLSQFIFNSAVSSVGYCHVEGGCKLSATRLRSPSGIARTNDDTFYIADRLGANVGIYERQADNSLVLTDQVKIGRIIEGLAVDEKGHIYAITSLNWLAIMKHMRDLTVPRPSSVFKVSLNTGRDAYFGQKYTVSKIFEDDGTVASCSTTAVTDIKRKRVYLHSTCLTASHLTICHL